MHMHHSERPAQVAPATKIALAVAMSLLFLATVAGLVMLWPSADALPEKRPFIDPGVRDVVGVVVDVIPGPDGGNVRIEVEESGEVLSVAANPDVPAETFRVGERIRAIGLPATAESAESGYTFVYLDHERGQPLLLLFVVFVLVVVVVARWKGVAALIGLFAALATVWYFLLPALFAGENALAVALVTASAVMFIVVYFAHGVSVKTTTALLGTFAGISLVAGLTWWAIPAVKLMPLNDESLRQLSSLVPAIDPKGVLLCGMVLAGVGVLNDVTITQSSAVWELRGASPESTRLEVFVMAMRIGRDHIASTVYTVAFAYLGTALALIMMGTMWDRSVFELLTFEVVASELVGIMVCSIGLVLTIPLTTALAAALCGKGAEPEYRLNSTSLTA